MWRAELPKLLPSPLYRVTAKAMILDNQQRLLVLRARDGTYEMPGGGMEHGETFEDCLAREFDEEFGGVVADVGPVECMYTGRSRYGFMTLRLVARAALASYDPASFCYRDSIVAAEFVAQHEFPHLDFARSEAGILDCANIIWPPAPAQQHAHLAQQE